MTEKGASSFLNLKNLSSLRNIGLKTRDFNRGLNEILSHLGCYIA
jgi:hypothetical protein